MAPSQQTTTQQTSAPPLTDWIGQLFQYHDLTRMGHCQRVDDRNLGLGWVYYGLARVIRRASVVVIGSYRGFVPLVLGRALSDNLEGGQVYFIDPSFVDDFWTNSDTVSEYFSGFGVTNIQHFRLTTQQFVDTDAYRSLSDIGLVFVDGYHSEEQVRFDYQAFCNRLSADGVMLFHDSIRNRVSGIYSRANPYEHRVKNFLDGLKQDNSLQVFDLPFGDGVTLVRRASVA